MSYDTPLPTAPTWVVPHFTSLGSPPAHPGGSRASALHARREEVAP